MSIHDETWDRPKCQRCSNTVKHGQGERHINGICKRIVNVKNGIKGKYLYIGRANKTYGFEESIFHNPFIIGKDGDREEIIEKFEEYAWKNKEIMDNLHIIDDYNLLGCWCSFPFEDCHGRILLELRQWQKLIKIAEQNEKT